MRLLGRHCAIHLTLPHALDCRVYDLGMGTFIPAATQDISRKFPLPHELGGQVGVGAGLPHRALARERVIAEVEIARLLRATVSDLERNTVPTAATATLVLSMRCRIRTIPNRNID